MSNQPKVFVASSREGLHVAEAVNIKLENDARVKLWDNAFDLSSTTIQSLLSRAHDSDFAVFVFHADDKTIIRGNTYSTVRDNVLFELGLFIGALNLERCFILAPKSTEVEFRLPTDLAGVTISFYDDSLDDMVDAVTASCAKIKVALKRLGTEATEAQTQPKSEELANLQRQLGSVQSELWRTRIDAERSIEEKSKLLAAISAHFYATAKPATEAEIRAWEEGAKQTYPDTQTISRHGVYYVDHDVIVPPLFGAHAVALIVAKGARVAGLDQWSHNTIYFMDGFRKLN
ncbi:nucleotide-binding protein [Aquabacterium sp. NJ1]|uniref:TIR domain-containing protein n=1 Tax=Aquabacterium sp. NJ1 TaxID=1538295 RepID=UPI00052C357B|nr:nucleotide-binding protein [Aquabacterium sp. NJ1]KGM38565.1 nucleotide-binding protein [Aquabacterium sp. NJ1]